MPIGCIMNFGYGGRLSFGLSFLSTVNVDIFACIDFRGSTKMGNFAWIKICAICKTGSLSYCKNNFHSVYILADI